MERGQSVVDYSLIVAVIIVVVVVGALAVGQTIAATLDNTGAWLVTSNAAPPPPARPARLLSLFPLSPSDTPTATPIVSPTVTPSPTPSAIP